MNCARLRLNAETTTIFVRDGWLIIEAAEADALRAQMAGADGDRLVTVAEVSERTGFTAGAVRDWIKRSVLAAVRVGKEYRVREADLAKLLDGNTPETVSISKRIGRRRKAVSV
jgi:excisionase family DNA binding protein